MKALLLALLLVTLALAGCSGSKDGGFVTPPQDDEGRYLITMKPGLTFEPKRAEVPVGATVLFVNEGGAHDVTADDGSFKSPMLNQGQSWEHTFDEAGEVEYHCTPHEGNGMKGTIRVVAGDEA